MTRAGWATLVVSGTLLATGYALAYPELLALAVAGLVVLGLGAVAVSGRPRVELEREIRPLRVTRGEPCVGVLTVKNLSTARRLRVDAFEPCAGNGVDTQVAIAVPTLPRGGTRQATYRLPTARRAVLDVGPLRWERADPFGLWRRRQQLGTLERMHVHPRVHVLDLAASGRARHLDGPTSDTAPRGSITFHALREYVRGDDMRHVHWKSSARLQTLMVKEHVDTALPHTTVLFDTRASAYDTAERFEEAVDLVASLLTASTRSQFPCRLVTSAGVSMEAKGSHEETRAVLDLLSGVETSLDGGFLDMADALDHRRSNSIVVCVTGALSGREGEADLSAVRTLGRRYDRALLVRLVPDGAPGVATGEEVVVVAAEDAAAASLAWNIWSRR
ncbi:MAG TPA: DUF58 domain-containing protein [Actinomycetales bacterium]|nr:DUF58 domain-containing protein [Actinomycetales bacterium]